MHRIAKAFTAIVALVSATGVAHAQGAAAPATKTYTTPAEVQAMIAAKKAGPLAATGPYLANMEYRDVNATGGAVTGGGASHPTQDELIYVISGTGSLKVGGTLVNPKPGGANIIGTDISGGTDEALVAGTIVLVPAGTPHAFTVINGPLVDMSIKLPEAKPAQ